MKGKTVSKELIPGQDDEKNYLVTWKIDISAESPEQAAWQAKWIQIDPLSVANHFEVIDEEGNTTFVWTEED